MKKYSVIFDLDGTLWEVTDVTYESVNEIAKKYNLNRITKDTICNSFGLNRKDCAKMYFPNINIEKALMLMDEIAEIKNNKLKNEGGNLYKNLKKILLELNKKYRLFIVSNTGEDEYIDAFLTTSGLTNIFEDYIAASKLGLEKGQAIKKIIDDNKIEKSIYVGDTIKDQEAADFANILFIQTKYGFGKDLNTKYYIKEFNELPKVLNTILQDNKRL